MLAFVALALGGLTQATVVDASETLIADLASTSSGSSVEVSDYAAQFGVSKALAEERLKAQEQALEALPGIREQLGSSYAGAWFNNRTGQLDVSSVDPQAASSVAPLLASDAIAGSTKIVTTHSSWSQLERAQSLIDVALTGPEQHQEITTGFDLESNAVTIRESANASAATEASVSSVAEQSNTGGVNIEVTRVPAPSVTVKPDEGTGCHYAGAGSAWLHCARPLRGGISIEDDEASCSYGFLGYWPSEGEQQYVLTAGHCLKGDALGEHGTTWYAVPPEASPYAVGPAWNWQIGGDGDFGLVRINMSSYWAPVWPGDFVVDTRPGGLGWEDQMEKIVADDTPGLYNCHTGETSKTVCGEVLSVHNSFCYEGGEGCPGDMTEDSFSGMPGDSGGPVWANNWAFGIMDGAGEGGLPSYYSELESILPAEARLNIALGE